MLKNLHISNFKSIYDETIELGRFNVFIGENGSGKTNILEALGMASAASFVRLSNDELVLKGIRVTKPTITFSSFIGNKQEKKVILDFIDNEILFKYKISTENENDIFVKWLIDREFTSATKEESSLAPSARILMEKINNEKNISLEERVKLMNKLIEITGNKFVVNDMKPINHYKIFNLSTQILRGIGGISREIPGIRGENLDRLIESFDKEERAKLEEYAYFINWLDKIEIDKQDRHKLEGHKLDMSTSILYFRDKYMQRKNNLFSAENANEGVLHILFYLALFISKHTPKLFAIDNIETALNPELCKKLIEQLVKLSKEEGNERQVLITTHSPSVLDGLNLHDDEQRLFKVYRNKKGHTKVKRIQLKPNQEFNGQNLKLSELWMRNYIGAIPQNL